MILVVGGPVLFILEDKFANRFIKPIPISVCVNRCYFYSRDEGKVKCVGRYHAVLRIGINNVVGVANHGIVTMIHPI